jgi:hypothetical protein
VWPALDFTGWDEDPVKLAFPAAAWASLAELKGLILALSSSLMYIQNLTLHCCMSWQCSGDLFDTVSCGCAVF